MTIPYSSGKNISIDQLTNVNMTDIANNDILQYNATTTEWNNGALDLSGQDINVDEIDCRVLRVSETADIVGRLANEGVASFVNEEFVFQNGVSDLGNTLYIDNQNNRVGINISNPEEDLEIDGSIQIDSASVSRLKFQKSGGTPHQEAEIDAETDGTNGGQLEFLTKVDGGSVSEKLRINNVGAVGIGGANYGTSGQVLTSGGSNASVSWTTPSSGGGGITQYATFSYQPTTANEQVVTNTFTAIKYDTIKVQNSSSDITIDTTTNVGRITLVSTGIYMVNYHSTLSNNTSAGSQRIIMETAIWLNTGSGFINQVGTSTFAYGRQGTDPENSSSCSFLFNITSANALLEVRMKTADSNITDGRVKSGATGITILKIA